MGKLDGKVAVVTGASSGLGLASAKRFAEEGAYVFISGRNQAALDAAVAEIGSNVSAVQGDAADLDDLDRLFAAVDEKKGRVDVLFASAGRAMTAPLGEVTEQDFDAMFGLNARGTLFTVQKALPLLSDGASIVLTSTTVAAEGWPDLGVYAASKAALRSYAGTWLSELASRKIRVNVLSPGQIATPAQDELQDRATTERYEAMIPRGYAGTPDEVAGAALFLASDESSFVNGIDLRVDGGMGAFRSSP